MNRRKLFVSIMVVLGVWVARPALAGSISAADVSGLSSYTTPDGKVTLSPFAAGGAPGQFGPDNSCCIGVAGGSNANGVDDLDGDPATTGDRERLDIALAVDTGLSSVDLIFTRANGPALNDGVVIEGFLSDPQATVDAMAASSGVTATFDNGSVYINHLWRGGAVTNVVFDDLSASLGQTLSVGANDSDEATPQAVFNQFSYNVIPEPSALMLVGGALAAWICATNSRRSIR